ncbi:PAS domain-containing sensor histidine kinase [Microvirga mediterraneensis]|uniref:histidine kinase n=1 Tax=Microvirga mediterraneensis TaxID=2754695 RepID=A0A838BUE3_9HYPH|nr:PAS domain-containing protein [Microvirga mediterraneensis]MBA1158533.1 PAS domain S-box protein [Microvirga mediterraneensis]
MTGGPDPFEALIAQLAAEPDLSLLARPGTGVLVWDQAGERLLWASPAAAALRGALTDEAGRTLPGLRARDRIKALAGGLAPRHGALKERLRLDPSRPWLPVATLCRLASLETGETVLVTAFVGPVPKVASSLRTVRQSEPPSIEPSAPVEGDATRLPDRRPGPVRFIWHTDAATRFTDVSHDLPLAVGAMAGNIVGQTWEEVSRSVVEDPDGSVAALFGRRETWSGRTILWSIDNSSLQVPVDWAGMPVFGPGRELIGFRGFGLLRMDDVQERTIPDAAADLIAQSLVNGETLPFRPPEEMPGEEPTAEAAQSDEDTWFSNLRDQVAAALSGPKPPDPEPIERPRPAEKQSQASGLSSTERNAFREIARALGARLEEGAPLPEEAEAGEEPGPRLVPPSTAPEDHTGILNRLPIGILVHRGEAILFANRFLLDLTGYEDIDQIRSEGGLVHLFRGSPVLSGAGDEDSALALTTRANENISVAVRASSTEWDGEPADLMVIRRALSLETAPPQDSRIQELEAILDTATDGVIVLNETGRILSLNRSAEALFGYDEQAVAGDAITVLLAPESHMVALDYLESLRSPGMRSLLNDGREVVGRERQGGAIPLFMTMGRLGDGPDRRFCAVLRDITAFKRTEGELLGAKHAAEEASAQKSDLLATISHEIRTPLNAILGFAEVMLEERFGSIGNDRYKEYLKDIHASGSHVISLVNDLLDLAKIEAGRLELSFTGVSLNELVSSCVTLLQPQAARDRIVMRMSFAPKLPPVVADERSMRQIVLNLVSNAIKFTDAGGQVIVSTAMTDRGEVAFRVRDTGIGMTPEEVEAALEPFRQLATSRRRGGTGLGLPLTKALVEANRGALQIASQPSEGTLVEVIFPPTRVMAE